MTSIHDIVRNGDVTTVRTFIATGKDLNAIDKHLRTGLHLAAWTGHIEILQLLIRAKADISKKAMDGFTVLHFAATSNAPTAATCIQFIGKKARAIIHQRTTKGLKSALHLAIPRGRVDIVTALLEIGLDPLAKMTNGQTAVELARNSISQSKPSSTEVYQIVKSFAEERGGQFKAPEDDGNENDDEDGEEGSECEDDEDNESVEDEIASNENSDPDEDEPAQEGSDQPETVLGKRLRDPAGDVQGSG